MKNSIQFTLAALLIFFACEEKTKSEESITPDGIWEQIGYGRAIEIRGDTLRTYDMTSQNCIPSSESALLDFGKIKSYTKDTLVIQHGIDHWPFVRVTKLPELCSLRNSQLTDPTLNFQTFWNTFNEHYASFDLKGVDWTEVYQKYAPKISEETTEVELYGILREMTDLLNDGHISIHVPDSIKKAYEQQVDSKRPKYSKLDEWRLNSQIAEQYVDSLRNYNAGMIRYGLIDKEIGYIQINSMLMLANYDLSQGLTLRDFFGQYWPIAQQSRDEIQRQEEVDGVNEILDHIISEFSGAKSYIIDLRFNGGGKDGVAMAILNHFSNIDQVAFTKKARSKNGFTDKQLVKVTPSDIRSEGNVYLLTSHFTASASEILVLASLGNTNFTRIGSTTEGIFSSTLDKKLPNGWEYELSNEVYEDLNGNNYENVGISPDHSLKYPTDKDLFFDQLFHDINNGKDTAIDLAIAIEKERKK